MEDCREMATQEDQIHCAQPDYVDYRQVAKLLRDRLTDFLEGGELPEQKLQRLLHMVALHKVVSYVPIDPVLWGSIPKELLPRVLARLPVPEITDLRIQLSKEWTMNMEFNRACDEAKPNMAALVSYAGKANEFLVRIFDFSTYSWLHVYHFCLTNRENAPKWIKSVWMLMEGDGGLVCFVSTWIYKDVNFLCIVVINLLTRVQHELPALQHVYNVPPTLVHMKVDSKTKGYKVVVAFNNEGCHTVETYDSILREWSKVAPSWGRVLGHACEWKICGGNYFTVKSSIACAFDLEEGQLELFNCDLLFQLEGVRMLEHVLVDDHVFVLYKELNENNIGTGFYFIAKFRFQSNAGVWVLVRTHDHFFPEDEDFPFSLHACENVLMETMIGCCK